MRTVRIVLTYPNKLQFHSWVTSLRLGAPYSHAAIVMKDDLDDSYFVIQASHGMVHELDLTQFQETHHFVKVFNIDLTEDQYIRGRSWMRRQLGKKYSFWGMIASTISIFRKLRIGQDGDRSFICSEFTFRFLEVALGIDIIPTGRGFDDYVCPEVMEGVLIKMQEIQSMMGSSFVGHAVKGK